MSGRYSEQFALNPSGNSNDGLTKTSTLLDGSTVVSASFTSVPVYVKDVDAYSVAFGTLAASTLIGTLSLQASNCRGAYEQTAGGGDVTMTDWQTISFWDVGAGAQATTKAVASGAQTLILAERGCVYRYMRLVFAFTSGSGLPKVLFQQKGWA